MYVVMDPEVKNQQINLINQINENLCINGRNGIVKKIRLLKQTINHIFLGRLRPSALKNLL